MAKRWSSGSMRACSNCKVSGHDVRSCSKPGGRGRPDGKKRCARCGRPKRKTEFNSHSSYCKPCQKVYRKGYQERNADEYRKARLQRRAELNAFVVETFKKGKPCVDCGLSFNPWVMDFDHRVAAHKSDGISKLINRCVPLERIVAEIQKCDLVCANCHRDRTHADPTNRNGIKKMRIPKDAKEDKKAEG